jgi:hypothetical protein
MVEGCSRKCVAAYISRAPCERLPMASHCELDCLASRPLASMHSGGTMSGGSLKVDLRVQYGLHEGCRSADDGCGEARCGEGRGEVSDGQ